jgi:hypothetical protein
MSLLFGPKKSLPPDYAALVYDLLLSKRALLQTPDSDPNALRDLGLEAVAQALRAVERVQERQPRG